ncbi:HIT domain-containing protein [Candidatus Pacearchaeota archaeon]|nr:HIT domain-containing protein [Candidatus Pacearchaeota archaeon]
MLPEEQVPQIKKQLLEQLDATNLPNKEEVKKSVEGMNAVQLEEFLVQNKLIKSPEGEPQSAPQGSAQPQQCIFCSIVFGDVPSHKIDENKDSIAVLELNPISKGHVIIIPKEHLPDSGKLPSTAFTLAKKIAKKLKSKLKSKDVEIHTSNIFGHEIINVIPMYEGETPNSERQQAKPEELSKLQKLLEVKKKAPILKKPKRKKLKDKKLWLPKRIP